MGDSIRLYRQGSNLHVAGVQEPVLALRADIRSPSAKHLNTSLDIQLGYPTLPKAGDRFYYELASEWLRQCDERHACARKSSDLLPTRVLDVGDPSNDVSGAAPLIRLYQPSRGERGRYITVSHCWGKVEPAEKARYCTYACNIRDRMRGISWDDLPQSFRDAVTVTRRLGIRYLWIDSICIIQPHQDCPVCSMTAASDWASECTRMEAYYSSAYCTIAATSAKDSREGFLRDGIEGDRYPRYNAEQFVEVPGPPGTRLYVCKFQDRFDRDVEDAVLNRRGWVLQERALSRRVLHFTSKQVYWECGKGVHSQTLTKMRSSAQRLMGDPQFPSAMLSLVKGDRISLFQQLFALYSRLALTEPTDRPLAIAGLESRLARTLKTSAVHGIFVRYLHRSLLWCRAGKRPLQRIQFPPGRGVPTWSWMAYKGEIDYMQLPFSGMEWYGAISDSFHVNTGQFTEDTTGLEDRKQGRAVFEVTVRKFDVNDEESADSLHLDAADYASMKDKEKLRCVVLGRDKPTSHSGGQEYYYVLIVMPVGAPGNQEYATLERVGVGRLLRSHLMLSEPGLRARFV
ncbi:heterokaryon incompatibility protein-domain-containing protein [Achaetomium macrosporum]|uniref:Heterokaryon incompatibility protein-domain-containing protein n=1 Tax=Achaetomium macrosporum TaxID=79813 RepID=A0AAN7C6B6_9PEZI|nr:heterokaryon incompatibility protein-domain-containing protein [Achaetomium macrosporum]